MLNLNNIISGRANIAFQIANKNYQNQVSVKIYTGLIGKIMTFIGKATLLEREDGSVVCVNKRSLAKRILLDQGLNEKNLTDKIKDHAFKNLSIGNKAVVVKKNFKTEVEIEIYCGLNGDIKLKKQLQKILDEADQPSFNPIPPAQNPAQPSNDANVGEPAQAAAAAADEIIALYQTPAGPKLPDKLPSIVEEFAQTPYLDFTQDKQIQQKIDEVCMAMAKRSPIPCSLTLKIRLTEKNEREGKLDMLSPQGDILGYAFINIYEDAIYVNQLHNSTRKDGIPHVKGVGSLIMQTVFEMSVLMGRQGHVTLTSAERSNLFYFKIGFRTNERGYYTNNEDIKISFLLNSLFTKHVRKNKQQSDDIQCRMCLTNQAIWEKTEKSQSFFESLINK